MQKTIEDVAKDKCTGCGACYNKCPVHAISMRYDADGFIYPYINHEKCIKCGICADVCSSEKEIVNRKYPQTIYAVYADKETREHSSSGGMFTLLSKHVLGLKGVVCGCKYSEDYLYAYHTIIDSDIELDMLRKSKYIQSEIRESYSMVEKYLMDNRWVLFTGTPCQVAGLYKFLGKDYKRLITADIICHGVPSIKAYHSFLDEISQGRKIERVDFRDKSIVPWGTVEYIKYEDGSYYYNDCNKGLWYRAFLNGISTRECCGTCGYANLDRLGDFTLGDFWGINEICEDVNSKEGVSLVIVNSQKAENLFYRLVSNSFYKKVDFELAISLAKKRNGNLIHPTINFYGRNRFFEMLSKDGFSSSVTKVLKAKYDIGIVGWWYNLNYGGTLTYYALHQVLRKMGFSVLMIAKTSEDPNYKPDEKSIPYRFAKKHYYISKNHSRYDMNVLNEHCEVFISGSDQLFNPILWQWSGPEYFLHFVNNRNKKISFASSFGNEFRHIGDLTEKMTYWLKRFDAISVREDYGKEICRETFNLESEKVLDPVFLCDIEEYNKVANQSKMEIKHDYFVNFFLDPNDEKREIIFYAERKLNKDYINLINADQIEENEKKLNMKNTKANADVEDWIKYYMNSDFVITDSFHGTCFAIIFHKPFISIANTARGEKRFISLLSELGLMDHLVYSIDDIKNNDNLFKKIDYTHVDELLGVKRRNSLDWLYNSIVCPSCKNNNNEFNLLDSKIFELEERLSKIEKQYRKM